MKKKNICIIIILVFLAVRLPVLLTFGRYADGDESVVGIMAKHIIEKGERPLALYGQAYGGGHVIDAYLAAVIFKIFGISAAALKLVPLLFSLGIILAAFYLAEKYFNRKTAVITAVLLLTAGSFLRPSLKVNGYMETIFIGMISFILFLKILFDKKEDIKAAALLGFLSGLAYWSFQFAIAYAAFYMVMFLAFNKKFFRKGFFAFLAFLFIGASPSFFSGETAGSLSSIRDIVSVPSSSFANFFPSLARFFAHDMPGFLSIDNVHNFADKIPLTSWVYYAVFLMSLIFLAYSCREGIKIFIMSLFSKKGDVKNIRNETVIILFVMFYVLLYSLSKFSGLAPRYLTPLYPFISITIALSIAKIKNKAIAAVILLALVAIGLFDAALLLKRGTVTDGLVETPFDALPKTIDFLNQNNIRYVYSPYFTKWRLIFQAKEEIIASCDNLCACAYRYPAYESAVSNADKYAYVLHSGSTLNKAVAELLKKNRIMHKTKVIGTLTVYYDFSEGIRPADMLRKCPWAYAFV